ncbi:MAG: formylglycine-generating enzyme family protein [Myxococcota bacterium]|nr:formylglycine-generating enzyme family protein [Myxococcota bacterium]
MIGHLRFQHFLFTLLSALALLSCDSSSSGQLGEDCVEGDKCLTGLICSDGVCICNAETLEELCSINRQECGRLTTTDRCGKERIVACGTCETFETCASADGVTQCICTPPSDEQICSDESAECGELTAVDACGTRRTINCGLCTAPDICGGAEQANRCGCTGESESELCAQFNLTCGSRTVEDGCNRMRIVECGSCEPPQTCGGDGVENLCGCESESDLNFCIQRGAECGKVSGLDNCARMRVDVECGSCSNGTCGGGGKNLCGEDYALISPGSYLQGSPGDELGRDPDEGPVHTVSITRPFWVARTEVTNSQWSQQFPTAPSLFSTCGSECPVDSVNWYEAVSYLNQLSIAQGLPPCYNLSGCNQQVPGRNLICTNVSFAGLDCTGYRLPTEGEWEYIARAGSETALPSGPLTNFSCSNPDLSLDSIAWFCGNAAVTYQPCWDSSMEITGSSTCAGTHPVASKSPNDFGLHDMIGNLWEWTNDWYGGYPAISLTDPQGPMQGNARVVRGCAWSNGARFCRSASRNFYAPEYRFLNVGFRAVRTYSEN